jgi:endo-1,4-beta-D-glucanase Y
VIGAAAIALLPCAFAAPVRAPAGSPGQPASAVLLAETWDGYVAGWISPDGRVIDRAEGDRSTSEGQAYALVRALWADDRATFARVRAWTVANLQAGDPARLPAWAWGQRPDGTWGVLDAAPASDADQLIAWALIGADARWGLSDARADALALLASIWTEEIAQLADLRVLLPGPWAREAPVVQLNPSYWMPFTWRTFAVADPAHDWASLIDPAYALLEQCVGASGLATDWCHVLEGGRVAPAPRGYEAHDDFGFEALRVPWILAAEVRWHGEARARRLLKPYGALARRYLRDGSLPAVFAPDGRARVGWEYVGLYGALLPAWDLVSPRAAEQAWIASIAPRRASHGWGEANDYYGQNWVWMGEALRSGVAFPVAVASSSWGGGPAPRNAPGGPREPSSGSGERAP